MTVHVAAVVKGVVEGDPYQHFGSLLGFEAHLAVAIRLGVLRRHALGHIVATKRGLKFYSAGLVHLPDGRATYWSIHRSGVCPFERTLLAWEAIERELTRTEREIRDPAIAGRLADRTADAGPRASHRPVQGAI